MPPCQFEKADRIGFLLVKGGDTINRFVTGLAGGEDLGMTLNAEDLPDIGEFKVVVQRCAGPDVADFQPAMGLIG